MKAVLSIFILFFAAVESIAAGPFDSPFGSVPTVNQREAKAIKSAQEAETQEEQREILEEAASRDWAGAAIFFNLANAFNMAGDYAAAVKNYRLALEKTPSFFMAQKNLGFTLVALEDEKSAFEELKKALALSGGSDSDILFWLASRYARSGDYSSALACCNQALIYAPENQNARLAKAAYLFELGSIEESERLCAAILGNSPDNADALRILGKARAKRGDFNAAISAFEILRIKNLAQNNDKEFLADIYFHEKNYSSAAEIYLECGNVESAGMAAEAMANAGLYNEALALVGKISGYKNANKIKAVSYAGLGELGRAKAKFEAHLHENFGDAHGMFLLAQIYMGENDYEHAMPLFEKTLKDERLGRASAYGLLRIYSEQGNWKSALGVARLLNAKYPDQEIGDYMKYLEEKQNELD